MTCRSSSVLVDKAVPSSALPDISAAAVLNPTPSRPLWAKKLGQGLRERWDPNDAASGVSVRPGPWPLVTSYSSFPAGSGGPKRISSSS